MRMLHLLASLLLATCYAQAKNPVEVGDVAWGRDYDVALEQAKQSGKPIFLLFQEVPGCAGCKQFGQDVLTDPEVVDTIESNFIPLLIHNNKPGEDARIRKRYSEPAWNYQVVRFLDEEGQDIIPRKDRVWSKLELLSRIRLVLTNSDRKSLHSKKTQTTARVALCQYCFWTGEMKIGAIPGVLITEAGFIDGREVTLATYDPSQVSLETLVQKAGEEGVASSIYLDDPTLLPGSRKIVNYRRAPESDQKRQLQGTRFDSLDLTPIQATKVNAFARSDSRAALKFLTPEQLDQLKTATQGR